MTTPDLSRVRRAYTIVWFRDPDSQEIFVLNGREVAIHAKALREFQESAGQAIYDAILNKEQLLGDDGSNRRLRIQRNLSGVLMIGRSALPGGRIDRGETPVQAAYRELDEEMGFRVTETDFVPLVTHGENTFYTLDLTLEITTMPDWLRQLIRDFKPNSDKRELEIVTPQTLIQQLEAPDEKDEEFITTQMRKLAYDIVIPLAKKLEKPLPSEEVINELTLQLIRYQLARPLTHHVDAVHKFLYQ